MARFTYDNLHFSFNQQEVFELALALKCKLEGRLTDKHYDQFPDSWEKNTQPTMNLFRTICRSIGRRDLVAEFEKRVTNRFEAEPSESTS
jgi:hypothetical protein